MNTKDYGIYCLLEAESDGSKRIGIHVALRVLPENVARARIDLCVCGDSRANDAKPWESGELLSGPGYHTSGSMPGVAPEVTPAEFVNLTTMQIYDILSIRMKRAIAPGGETRCVFRAWTTIEGAIDRSQPESFTLPGSISFEVMHETHVNAIGTELRELLIHPETGSLRHILLPSDQPEPAAGEPVRLKISIEQRDALIKSGAMPMPKNLQPRENEYYDLDKHTWVARQVWDQERAKFVSVVEISGEPTMEPAAETTTKEE